MYNEEIRKRDILRKESRKGPDADYIVPLYRLALSNVPVEKIADWLAINGLRYGNQMVRRTLKYAGREDLIDYLIKEEDIQLGDTVKSRSTARVGKVIEIRGNTDGTVVVKWDSGGKQLISKESLFKLRSQEINSTKDFSQVASDKGDVYDAFEKKNVYKRENK